MNKVLLVTKRAIHITGIDIRKSIERVSVSDYKMLIYVDSDDLNTTLLVELAALSNSLEIVYLNSNLNPFVSSLVHILKGHVISEEALLSEEGVRLLTETVGNTGFEVKPQKEVLEKLEAFFDQLMSKIQEGNIQNMFSFLTNSNIVRALETAQTGIQSNLELSEEVNDAMVRTLRGLKIKMQDMEREKESLTQQMQSIKDMYATQYEEKNNAFNIDFYPTYTVIDRGIPVMYVRVHGHCPYLTSFLLSYQHYLANEKNKVVKTLIIIPKNKLTTKKYSKFMNISSNNSSLLELSKRNVYYTSDPKKNVLDTFFNQKGVQVFIVLDLTYGDKLLQGSSVKNFAAASGVSDFTTFDLNAQFTFTSGFRINSSLVIFPIKGYLQLHKEPRIKAMLEKHKSLYNFLNAVLGVQYDET